ncbi:MAG TPA: LysM peptidoglycan-binding domain-containing protein [Bacillota bacterium]|nr:LysM peptidoglycan-binding domain-containing protein [Bacillota bacterium]HOR86465.1 LysM peptidoglycan-binding domain-containing protein [Bacillota bacterium]HPL54311.1 LysM peptidoglycan-binding domain-containing protein [Bacillota bacterium]
MWFKKLLISSVLCTSMILGSATGIYAASTAYTVQKGDTYWIISQKLDVPITGLMAANNATQSTIIYPGQKIVVPQYAAHIVTAGETYWKISQKYGVDINELMSLNGANANSYLYIGQKIKIPANSKPYITYKNYTVVKGDTYWSISNKFGIPLAELLKANNLSQSAWPNIGDIVKIPVHNVPIKSTPGAKYGEALDWWTEAQYVIPTGADFEVYDFSTGKSFFARRTTGANHADCETLTAGDTKKMKEIWGGKFSWVTRPVIIKYNGRKIAASMSSMPHAGNDAGAGGEWTSWRSGDYGAGINNDWVKNNGINGVFDIHFLNSTRHKDGKVDANHQASIKISAGLK